MKYCKTAKDSWRFNFVVSSDPRKLTRHECIVGRYVPTCENIDVCFNKKILRYSRIVSRAGEANVRIVFARKDVDSRTLTTLKGS